MRVTLLQTGVHAPWQEGEIVTLQVLGEQDDVGGYECETLETYPSDLKGRHAAEKSELTTQLTDLSDTHRTVQSDHTAEMQALTQQHETLLKEHEKVQAEKLGIQERLAAVLTEHMALKGEHAALYKIVYGSARVQ